MTSKTPVGTLRGPGRFEANFFRERLIDYEVLILPFSNDGERVDLLMTGIVPDQPL